MQEPLPLLIEPATDTGLESAPRRRGDRGRRRPSGGDWRIDPLTRRAGLQGVARARAALEATGSAARPTDQPDAA